MYCYGYGYGILFFKINVFSFKCINVKHCASISDVGLASRVADPHSFHPDPDPAF
jgi:hypothetical protein